MKGVYALILYLDDNLVTNIGVRENVSFERGYWVYIGSAQGTGSTNLRNRLDRHFRQEKKIHWHIDYLLKENVELVDAIWSDSLENFECELVSHLLASGYFRAGPTGFGAGDCTNKCTAHLISYPEKENPMKKIERAFRQLGLNPRKYSLNRP